MLEISIAFLVLVISELLIVILSRLYYRKFRELEHETERERHILTGQMVAWLIPLTLLPISFVVLIFGGNNNSSFSMLGLDVVPVLWLIICSPSIIYVFVSAIKNQLFLLFIWSFHQIDVVVIRGTWAAVLGILLIVGMFMLSILIFL